MWITDMHKRVAAFMYAFRGVVAMIRTQPHARFHLAASLLVITAGWWCDVSRFEWMMLALAIGLVWIAEAMNSAIEFLGDAITKEHHPLIGQSKDIAAGGVLLAAITAAVIGVLVFW
jgi:diacylglycerol kinase